MVRSGSRASTRKRKVYMLVDLAHAELPIAVADSTTELARISGVQRQSILSSIHNARKRGCRCRYEVVEIDEDEDGYSFE